MATTYLTWTPSGDGDKVKWTFSAWVKRTNIGSSGCLFWAGADNSTYSKIVFASDSIDISEVGGGSTTWQVTTNRKFKDCNAFYHVVVTYDSAQATASNRVKLYINGVQETSFSTSDYPTQNKSADWFGASTAHRIGRDYISQYFEGVMSHIHICNGYAYSASDFGETDSTTGEWKIKTSPSVSYGTYGSWILKDGNTITDSSPNSNNWTLGAGTLTKTEDNPSNVFATMNPLIPDTTNYTYSNGNTTVTQSGTATWVKTVSTLGVNSGKYYWEIKANNATISEGYYLTAGVSSETTSVATSGHPANGITYKNNGSVAINQSIVATINGYVNGDIISFYLDMDNGALYIAKNGVLENSGVPTSGASKTGAFSLNVPNETHFACISPYGSTASPNKVDVNFGNGYFGTTAVATNSGNGYAGAEGSSIFNYQPPTGYSALSTKGLNL